MQSGLRRSMAPPYEPWAVRGRRRSMKLPARLPLLPRSEPSHAPSQFHLHPESTTLYLWEPKLHACECFGLLFQVPAGRRGKFTKVAGKQRRIENLGKTIGLLCRVLIQRDFHRREHHCLGRHKGVPDRFHGTPTGPAQYDMESLFLDPSYVTLALRTRHPLVAILL